METITLTLYGIDELPESSRQKAFEENRYFNVDCNFWYSFVLDNFCSLCNSIGVDVKPDRIWFSGFYHQGNGSNFEANVNLPVLVNGIRNLTWNEIAPKLDLPTGIGNCDKRIIALIEKGAIDFNCGTIENHRGYWLDYFADYDVPERTSTTHPNIWNELATLNRQIKSILHTLNKHLYDNLEEAYEYEISDEALTEAFKANEYRFTSDGTLANKLIELSDD